MTNDDSVAESSVSLDVFSLSVADERIRKEALRICQLYVGGDWNKVHFSDISLERLDGLSNYVFKLCHAPENPHPQVGILKPLLLRIHGAVGHELVIETVTASILAERNFGPKLYGIFPEGRLEEFVLSRRLNSNDLRDPECSNKIAQKMAAFHKLNLPVMKSQWLLLQTTAEYFELINQIKPETEPYCSNKKILKEFDHTAEIQYLKGLLGQSKSPIVFCHNDLQEGNILSCDNDSKLLFIDYEYSCYNYRNFDITNHFLEWIATYEYGDTPGFGFDMNKFPSQEEQERFVHKYLTESGFEANSEAIQSACREILNEIPIFSLYSHLLWSSWGICVQFHNSATCSSDCMDYLSYSVGRLQMYHQTKTEIEKRKL